MIVCFTKSCIILPRILQNNVKLIIISLLLIYLLHLPSFGDIPVQRSAPPPSNPDDITQGSKMPKTINIHIK